MIEIQKTLDALGLKGHFSLSKKVDGKLVSGTFATVERAEEWIGDGETDCYLTGNSVREGTTGKAQDSDVEKIKILLVDCDPKKDSEKDPDGTSQERMDAAWTVASDIWEHFGQKGVLVASGRGAQVWLRVEFGIDRRALLGWIRDEFKHELVDVDATHDYSRLMRLPNTVNTRTGEVVALIDDGVDIPVSVADVRDLLASWAPPVAFDIPEADRSEPSERDIRRYVLGEALTTWREDPLEITRDRSKRDFTFLRQVIERGAPLAVASRLLHALPGAKANDRHDEGYWTSTVTAALTSLADERQSNDVIANLIPRVEADEDYLLKPETLKALARVYIEDVTKWVALRAQLKPLARAQGLGIGDLEKAIKAQASRLQTKDSSPPDEALIFTRAQDGGKGSWKVRDVNKRWTWASLQEANMVAKACDLGDDATTLALKNPFSVGLVPFSARILPGRIWNESNARFAVDPVEGAHPMWTQLYNVVGRGLDNDLVGSKWAKENGIDSGGKYLLAWAASMLQDPKSRRAYLALFSEEQGTGKSLFFESFTLLMGKAVVKGNNALMSERGFNGEFANAVLVYTEEIDLGANGRVKVYNRVKDYTLALHVSIEAKGGQVYEVPNVLSMGSASNNQSYVPVFDGDDRVTLFEVFPPLDEERMPKDVMMKALKEQAPAFLHTLMNLPLPAVKGRYVVPPVATEVKHSMSRANRDELHEWLDSRPEWILMDEVELVDSFRAYLESRGFPTRFWTARRIKAGLPHFGQRTSDLWRRLRNEVIEGDSATAIKEKFGLVDPVRRLGKSLRALSEVEPRMTSRILKGVQVYDLSR